jgi:hypothetical protein
LIHTVVFAITVRRIMHAKIKRTEEGNVQ